MTLDDCTLMLLLIQLFKSLTPGLVSPSTFMSMSVSSCTNFQQLNMGVLQVPRSRLIQFIHRSVQCPPISSKSGVTSTRQFEVGYI